MFYDRLKLLCDKKGEKITPLTKRLGMSSGSIKNWQNGILPNGETLLKFADYFGVSTDYLLTGKEYTYEKESSIMGKRFLNKMCVRNALSSCLGTLYQSNTTGIGQSTNDSDKGIDSDRLQQFSEDTNIPINRLNGFIKLINGEGTENDYPTIIELKSMMLVSDNFSNESELLLNRLEFEQTLLKEMGLESEITAGRTEQPTKDLQLAGTGDSNTVIQTTEEEHIDLINKRNELISEKQKNKQ